MEAKTVGIDMQQHYVIVTLCDGNGPGIARALVAFDGQELGLSLCLYASTHFDFSFSVLIIIINVFTYFG